jgi:hypothetical protein
MLKILVLVLLSQSVFAEVLYVTPQITSGTLSYRVSNNPQPYSITPPKVPDLKPICANFGKDFATTQWLKCAEAGQLRK